jgi:hypothetical protein
MGFLSAYLVLLTLENGRFVTLDGGGFSCADWVRKSPNQDTAIPLLRLRRLGVYH